MNIVNHELTNFLATAAKFRENNNYYHSKEALSNKGAAYLKKELMGTWSNNTKKTEEELTEILKKVYKREYPQEELQNIVSNLDNTAIYLDLGMLYFQKNREDTERLTYKITRFYSKTPKELKNNLNQQ